MPAARYVRPPKLQATTRASLDVALHPKFDSALKDLRVCSRQLSSIQACLEDELRILDRLYYKGVNQHRSALFWRKVEEIRRLGSRILELQLFSLIDTLRYSFYIDTNVERNPKILRNAWSQVPDIKYVSHTLERMRSSILLANKARERFASAHHTFTLMLQTGAFLQFILVLTALVSRLDMIASELQIVLQNLEQALTNLVESLGGKARSSKGVNEKLPQQFSPPLLPPETQTDLKLDELLGEDLGSTVVRTGPAKEPPTELRGPQGSSSLFWQDTQSTKEHSPDQHAASSKPIVIVTAAAEAPSNTKETPSAAQPSKKKVKKKRKRDEIDDIFGSL